MFPETHAKIPRVKAIIADVPAASPSIPSVRFAPLETAAMIKMVINTNTIQAWGSKLGLIQVIKSA